MSDDVRAWSTAWQEAQFGDAGFYRRDDGRPERHFATHVTDGPETALALLDIALPMLPNLLDRHGTVTVTDVGAGDGTLLRQLARLCPPDLAAGIRWRGVDLRSRPVALPAQIEWIRGDLRRIAPQLAPVAGMVVAHEVLDDVPCDVVEIDDDGRPRLVTVDPVTGMTFLGPDLDDLAACRRLGVDASQARDWLARWWPGGQPAARREVGAARDEAWRSMAGLVLEGPAVAVDYGHVRTDRLSGAWDGGTLAAYRGGRLVSAVPDGSCNLTAHVAMDSCAAAVRARRTRLAPSPGADDFWWLVQEMGA